MPFLHVNDIELHYEMAGKGEPLLLIHGLGSSGRDWQSQIDFFSRRYQVVVFDIRGHGLSGHPPGPYSIGLFADDTAKLIEHLLVPPVHVLGLSLGGMIGFQLAVDYPRLLKSMTVVNVGPQLKLKSPRLIMKMLRRFMTIRFRGMRKMGESLAWDLFPGAEHASIREIFIERWAENDKRAYLDTMKAIMGWSVADRIDGITTPTLVVASDFDYTPVAFKEAFVARMHHAKLTVIPNAHHAVPIERPAVFNAVVASFLETQR
ncbi:MAG TPA: alpha/beta hydrolase [Syntrophales bacterium]|nr:alpha/beta hydrolase [Syntrophales bacterium]